MQVDRIDVHGPIAWAAGQYTVTIPSKEGGTTQVNGAWLQVLKQEGAVWRIRAASFTRVKKRPDSAQPATTPEPVHRLTYVDPASCAS